MPDDAELLIPYRLRTVRVGVHVTYLALLLLAAYPSLGPSADIRLLPYFAVIAAALVGAIAVALAPWERMFRTGYGVAGMYVWSVGDIVLITVAVAVSGGIDSEMWAVYALTTVFFAASYPPRAQVSLLALTAACYAAVVELTGGGPLGVIVLRVGSLGLLTVMASFLYRELMGQIADHHARTLESQRRAELLSTVAGAARSIHTLDAEQVLEAVVDAAVALGFDAAGIAHLGPSRNDFEIRPVRGLPMEPGTARFPTEGNIVGAVLGADATLVADGRPGQPPIEALVGPDFGAVAAVPVRVSGRVEAVLGALSVAARTVTGEDVEALELLAALAGSALENAQLFAGEQRTVARLEQLDRLKSDFISNVSHELRTPLTVLEGMSDTLHQRWDALAEERRRQLVGRMAANAASLHRTIAALLDFARVEAGRLEARPQPLDLAVAIPGVADRLADLLARHPLTVAIDGEVRVAADPALFERVVENLLINAATHTPPGTAVRVIAAADGDDVLVAVADDGPGVPPDEIPHLTDRFFRGGEPNTRTTRGLGLGLALVHEILDLHGTSLQVDSQLGAGTCFSFRLRRSDRSLPAASYPNRAR